MILDIFDYTATLPLGLSVLLAHRTEGLRVRTAQKELDIAGDGFNGVLGGSDGKAISYLEPAGTLLTGHDGSKQWLIKSDSNDLTGSGGILFQVRSSTFRVSTAESGNIRRPTYPAALTSRALGDNMQFGLVAPQSWPKDRFDVVFVLTLNPSDAHIALRR